MRKYAALTTALVKNSFSFVDQGFSKKSKKWISIALIGILIVSFVPALVGLYFIAVDMLKLLIVMGQEGVVLALTFQLSGLIIFFFAIFLIPAIFYFSKDIEHLLSVPLRPVEIIASKFTVTYIYETMLLILLTFPVLLAYVLTVEASIGFVLMLILIVLTLPLLPLIFASVMVMAVMWLFPLFKNRDLFNMLSGIIILVFALWINFAMGGMEELTQGQLIEFIISGNNSLINIFRFIFVTYPYGLEALLTFSLLKLAIYVGLTMLIVAAFLLLSEFVYFRGVIGINETASRRKVLTAKQLSDSSKGLPAVYRYFLKEVNLLLRTPVYFLNCVSVQFLVPVLLGASVVAVPSQREAVMEYLSLIDFSDPNMRVMVLTSAVALGLVMGSINMISSTAISREGAGLYFMKIIPMDMMTQLHAKVASGIFYSMFGIVLVYGVIIYMIKIPVLLTISSVILTLIAVAFINYYSILIDVLRPKLIWESEQAAVKQNMNFLFTMIPAMGLSALMVYLVINQTISLVILPYVFGSVLVLGTFLIILILKRSAANIILNH